MGKNNLKILQVLGYGPGKIGALERFMVYFTRAALDRGHDLSIIFIRPPLPELDKSLKNLGARVLTHRVSSRLDLSFGFWLFRWLRREKIDLIDSHFDMVNLPGVFWAYLAGTPCRFWHQRNFIFPRLMPFKKTIYRLLNHITDGVICTSSILARDMVKRGIREDLVYDIPNGVDLSVFLEIEKERIPMREALKIPRDIPVVVMVSQAREEKGCIHLVRASRDIVRNHPGVRFIHVGGGPLEKDLKKEAGRIGMSESWMWLGERSDVPRILAASDLLVLPSYMEGFPNAVLEAQAAGVPVVASKVGGLPAAVREGETGILIPPKNEKAISEAVCRLLGDKALLRCMGESGKRFIRENFDVREQVRNTLDLYEKTADIKVAKYKSRLIEVRNDFPGSCQKSAEKKMKIAIVMGYGPDKIGALERFLFRFTEKAISRLHTVNIVFIKPPIEEVFSMLEKKGARIFIHSATRRLDMGFCFWLWKWLRKEKIDMIDSHFDFVNITGTFIAFLAGVPYRLWHQHNFISPRLLLAKKAVYRFFNFISHGIICPSSSLAEDMVKKGLRRALVYSLPGGIDMDIYEWKEEKKGTIRRKLGIRMETPVVIMVSQARVEKGCIHLVRASERIIAKFPEIRFIHVGGGPLEPDLKKEAKNLGVNDFWLWLGPRSDVPDLLSAADLLAVPSYMESLSYAALEAQAAGLPVLASNVGGVPLTVLDQKTGILVPPCDENALAEAAITLLGDAGLRKKMGNAGKKYVRENFSLENQVNLTMELYERIAGLKR
jgi:glycosyltransferase involved in cell wall biosynthesis